MPIGDIVLEFPNTSTLYDARSTITDWTTAFEKCVYYV